MRQQKATKTMAPNAAKQKNDQKTNTQNKAKKIASDNFTSIHGEKSNITIAILVAQKIISNFGCTNNFFTDFIIITLSVYLSLSLSVYLSLSLSSYFSLSLSLPTLPYLSLSLLYPISLSLSIYFTLSLSL